MTDDTALDPTEAAVPSVAGAPDPVTRAFESLSTLPALEGGFLRHLLVQAIDDPELATNPALAAHLYLVPQVIRFMPSGLARLVQTNPGMASWARKTIDIVAEKVAVGRDDISRETLAKLSLVALRDAAFLASFLEGHQPSPFL